MCADRRGSSEDSSVATCRKENLGDVQQLLEASPEAAPWSKQTLAQLFQQYERYFLLCFQREEIAGFICGRRVVDEGEILNLAVKPQCRRHGVGSALTKALLEVFSGEGVHKVFLEVRESNTRAIALYQSLGFQQVGKRIGYYREPDEAALVLNVTPPFSAGGE
jgi:ribosomal-protein-alanine N-acetyltransferase